MVINFIVGNHSPCVHVQDQIEYVHNGLLECGNHVAYSYFDFLRKNGINLFMENSYLHFYDQLINQIIQNPESKTFMIATEVIQKGSLNSANVDLKKDGSFYHNHFYWTERTKQFLSLLPYINGIVVVSEDLIDSYQSFGKPIFYLPLLFDNTSIKTNNGKDIDFLFTGTLTKHRDQIYKELVRLGFRVELLNTNAPNYIRDNYFSRTKVGLGLKLSDSTRLLSKFRAWYFLKNRIPCVFEGPVNETDLNPYLLICDNREEFIQKAIQCICDYKEHMQECFDKFFFDSKVKYQEVFMALSRFLQG